MQSELNDELSPLSPSYPAHDLCLANGAAHIWGRSFFLSQSSLEKLSQLHPELCLLGDSKSSPVEN